MTEVRGKYEAMFAGTVGAVGARAFTRGRQALVVLLKAIGVSAGDRIGVCGYTCLSVPEAVIRCGAVCVFLDIDEELCIVPEEILKQGHGGLKAVILQHTFGNPGNLDRLLDACTKIDAVVIEDCAQSFGGKWNGKPLGSFGAGAIYSFQWGKPYSTGQGGMLTVNSEEMLRSVDHVIISDAIPDSIGSDLWLAVQRGANRLVTRTAFERTAKKVYIALQRLGLIKGSFDVTGNFPLFRGYIKLAGPMMSRAGIRQLENWPYRKRRKQKQAENIAAFFEQSEIRWPINNKADPVLLRYPFFSNNKDTILRESASRGLHIAGWFSSPVHPLSGMSLGKVGYRNGDCPNAEKVSRTILHLPVDGWERNDRMPEVLSLLTGPYPSSQKNANETGPSVFRDEFWIPRGSKRILSYIGPPLDSIPEESALHKFLKRRKAFGAMWNYDGDYAAEGPWYRCICDIKGYSESSIQSANVRHNLRRSLKRCVVKDVDSKWLADNGYQVYAKAAARFENHSIISEDEYRKQILAQFEYKNRKAVGVFVDNKFAAYATLIVCENTVFGDTAFFDPDHSNAYPMYALYFRIAQDFLAAGFTAFDRGSKPLLHETGIDQFLLRLGFRFSYCRLGLYYIPLFRIALIAANAVTTKFTWMKENRYVKVIGALSSARKIAESTMRKNNRET
jgi:dTDP-4-amino-4,6-dideoxygalactose transaminase